MEVLSWHPFLYTSSKDSKSFHAILRKIRHFSLGFETNLNPYAYYNFQYLENAQFSPGMVLRFLKIISSVTCKILSRTQ